MAGLVYELFFDDADPTVVKQIVARPAIGSKSHEGMRFDPQGNLYSISERTPGYIFKFVPDRRGDLLSGQTYVLKVTQPTGDRTGGAEWIPLDRAAVQIDASAAADAAQATGYGRPGGRRDRDVDGQQPGRGEHALRRDHERAPRAGDRSARSRAAAPSTRRRSSPTTSHAA